MLINDQDTLEQRIFSTGRLSPDPTPYRSQKTSLPSPIHEISKDKSKPIDVEKTLRTLDDALIRLLERLDAIHPNSILLLPNESEHNNESGKSSSVLSSVLTDINQIKDMEFYHEMEAAVDKTRLRKRAVIVKIQGLLEVVDKYCVENNVKLHHSIKII